MPDGARCPLVENKARHPVEVEAWAVVGPLGGWRAPIHPRFTDRRPVVDWPAARAMVDDALDWLAVRDVLKAIEAGAREGASDGDVVLTDEHFDHGGEPA